MSSEDDTIAGMVEEAAGIVKASNNKVGIAKAMELVGFDGDAKKKMSLYQRMRRRAQHLAVVELGKHGTPPAAVVAMEASSQVSTLSSEDNVDQRAHRHSRRRILRQTPSPVASVVTVGSGQKSAMKTPVKKSRRSPKELQRHQAMVVMQTQKDKHAMKQATMLIHRNQQLEKGDPTRRSIESIVKEVNERMDSSISSRTAGRYVRQGLINVSPLKRGPDGHIPKQVYTALKGAFSTYLKLEQAESKKQSTVKELAKVVNACVNKGGHSKTRDDLVRKLRKDTAHHFSVGKANVQEARRVRWTTSYNLNKWFDTWKETLIELEFAREKREGDPPDTGELFFFEGQKRRIINLDETDGSLDDTKHQKGGRPPMTFHAPDVAGGATRVNKSGHSCTVICGSNAAGEPLPPHFQLKTAAQTSERERIGIDWIANSKNVMGRIGLPERRELACTFGMNDKGGMNAVELQKYMNGSIVPLFPDVEDKPSKRVICKVDSGPGRMNVEMLAALQLQGLYLVPGVPNTTGKTQETDQNYAFYKTSFRDNLRQLTQHRYDKKLTLQVGDLLPLLVFGGKCPRTGVQLRDAFTDAFSVEKNLLCWRKCGAVPLTRAPLDCNTIRHEVPVEGAAAEQIGEQCELGTQQLKNLESLNHFYVDFLSANGFDGDKLRKDAPTRLTFVAVTKPHSKDRVLAISKAKTAGQLFFATGGRHVNSNEFFQARSLQDRQPQIKAMEDRKKARALHIKSQRAAVLMIRSKGDLTSINEKEFTLAEVKMLLKWKKIKTKQT